MSDMNNEFEQLLEESLVTIHNGEIVEGTVISVKEDEIVLNIGYKADGIITRNEYSNQPIDLTTVVKEGDTLIKISKSVYGNTSKVNEIRELNKIEDNNIVVGHKLLLP